MSKKQRRQMRMTLTLSLIIAAVPLSLAVFFDAGQELPASIHFLEKQSQHQDLGESSKILPILANK